MPHAPAAPHSAEAQNLREQPGIRNSVMSQLLSLAQSCRDSNRVDEALQCYQAAVQMDPESIPALVGLADTLAATGQPALSIDAYLQALAIDPAHLVARVNLGALLQKHGHTADAIAILKPLIDAGTEHPAVGFNFATALSELGRFDDAREHYARVLPRHPRPAKVLYNLAQVTKFTAADRQRLASWTNIASQAIQNVDDQVHLLFALGKAHDDFRDFDAAWRHFAAGNNLVATRFDPDAHDRSVDATIARFSNSFFAHRADCGLDTEQPLFIVGMPRSGTTLVEQIISAHPLVEARGERPELGRLLETRARTLGISIPDAAASLTPLESQGLATSYLSTVAAGVSPPRFTDKMPFNFLHLGWIALLFPRARVIHVRRDPRDVGLSCYQTLFTDGLPFTYRLDHIARYWLAYDRLMTHWRSALPMRLLEVDYESILAAPEESSRRLIDFCGLDWAPACLSSHKQQRPVATASHWQVRQPIYQTSRARWQSYAPHLGPLLELLGDQ